MLNDALIPTEKTSGPHRSEFQKKCSSAPSGVGVLALLPFLGGVSFTAYGVFWKGLVFTLPWVWVFSPGVWRRLWTPLEVFSNIVEEVETVFCLGAHFSVLCFSLFPLTETALKRE